MTSHRTQVLLQRQQRHRRPADGDSIASRKRIPRGTRFLIDQRAGLVHDLAREKPECGLEGAFKGGGARIWMRPLRTATKEGLRLHHLCIGSRASDTFVGTETILLTMNAPLRPANIVRDLVEREQWGLRLAFGFEGNGDRLAMHDRLDRLGIPAIFSQAHRRRGPDQEKEAWGKPTIRIAIGREQRKPNFDDDVLADLFIPQALYRDATKIDAFTGRVMKALFSTKTLREAFDGHHRRYGYGDLVVYGHTCDTIDDWITPRPSPDCGEWSLGSGRRRTGGRGVGTCYS
jgi:hypothetical protein